MVKHTKHKEKEHWALAEILTELKEVIKAKQMFDYNNPSIIMCDVELEAALDMKALHVTEIRNLILRQLEKVEEKSTPPPGLPPPLSQRMREEQERKTSEQTALTSTPSVEVKVESIEVKATSLPPQNIQVIIKTQSDVISSQSSVATDSSSVSLVPSSREAVPVAADGKPQPSASSSSSQSLDRPPPGTSETQQQQRPKVSSQVYADKDSRFKMYPQLWSALSQLKDFNKNQTVFSYDEIATLLSKYILENKAKLFDVRNIKLAIVKDDPIGAAFGVQSFHRCQVTDLLRSRIIYLDPKENPEAYTDKNRPTGFGSLPAFPTLQKSKSVPAESGQRKRSPSPSQNADLPNDKQARIESEADTEEVATESEDDTYEVEFDIESGDDEEKRPSQAGGAGDTTRSSSDDDSDVEAKVIVEQVHVSGEDDFADTEGESGGQAEVKVDVNKEDNLQCYSCGGLRSPYVQYCNSCWENKKSWTADRPRRHVRRRKRATEKTRTSEDETDGSEDTCREGKSDSGVSSQELESYERELNDELAKLKQKLEVVKAQRGSTPTLTSDTSEGKRAESDGECSSKPSISGPPPAFQRSVSLDLSNKVGDKYVSKLCMFCCLRPKNASLIHGRLGHQVCCYPCAKKLWKKQARCPVCRRKIEKIVKIIVG